MESLGGLRAGWGRGQQDSGESPEGLARTACVPPMAGGLRARILLPRNGSFSPMNHCIVLHFISKMVILGTNSTSAK